MSTSVQILRQRGVSIVTALFLVVVLTGLAVAVVTLSTAQQTTTAQDLLGARAYEAARAGVEFGLYQNLVNGSCVPSQNVLAGGTLSVFTVTLTCTVATTPGMGSSLNVTTLTATACNIPQSGACPNGLTSSPDYVRRTVSVQF
ncbi:agglutinin biogenesis protein MshP [Duganella qianjiadongensis]|uniref:Agglutinin biogenesis protein MshP n=1 Tax=Duganella qianjiadongensis TaxID=2692176 RepID=A0ABW9VMS4_9BURK|nr:agglutinin biogenesis protein MshP [Duganella qianjiadongensis]MYM39910.1 agglutinin biogenesis protein MshP [Duganella qianjiadongensis]